MNVRPDTSAPCRIAAQPGVADVPSSAWDVVIAGAGPAGATAAALLAARGHRVLAVDRHAFPRDKVCGDGLISDSITALARLGALDDVRTAAHRVTRTSVYSAGRIRLDIDGDFMTLKRTDLDAIVAGRAAGLGAVLAHGTVTDIRAHATGVSVSFAELASPVRARYAIVATGADINLPRRIGMPIDTAPSALALRCYVRSRAEVDRLIISYDREILPGYAWIFPLRDGEYNVGCGAFFDDGQRGDINLRTMFERFTNTFPEARLLMQLATGVTPLKGAPLRCGLRADARPAIDSVLAIGETIATTFPFTGEGIGKAMETGAIAADTLHEALTNDAPNVLGTFSERVRSALALRYVGYDIAQRWLARPWITDLLARRAQRSAYLMSALGGILNETVDPRTVFSVGGLARSLLR